MTWPFRCIIGLLLLGCIYHEGAWLFLPVALVFFLPNKGILPPE